MKLKMAPAAADPFEPKAEINTTPLIDVMLVLLIMFIITVPQATHKVPVNLPVPGAAQEEAPPHRLDLDAAGRTYWDGEPIGRAALRSRLASAAVDPGRPAVHINSHAETRYERFDETLADVSQAGITRLGFVGTERFAAAIEAR